MFRLRPPNSCFFDRAVHRVRGQIDFPGPNDCAVFHIGFGKSVRVGQARKDPGILAVNKPLHLHDSFRPVEKPNPQSESAHGLDGSDPPRHTGNDLTVYLRAQNCRFSSKKTWK